MRIVVTAGPAQVGSSVGHFFWICGHDCGCCGRHRQQQRGCNHRAGESHRPVRHAAVASGIERREHASLELPRARHADGQRRSAVAAEGVGDLEQVVRVLPCAAGGRDDEIVARQLPLHAQASRSPPCRRVEPVHRTRGKGECLRKAVVARDVRHLVKHHGAPPVLRPGVGNGGDDDRRMTSAERHRHAALAASEQSYRTPHAQPRRTVLEQSRPLLVADLDPLTRQPFEVASVEAKPSQHHQHAGRIHGRKRHPPRGAAVTPRDWRSLAGRR